MFLSSSCLFGLFCSFTVFLLLKFSTDFAAIGTLDVELSPFTVSAQLLLELDELIELVDPNGCNPGSMLLAPDNCVREVG